MIHNIHGFCLLLLLAWIAGCDNVHEFPGENPADPSLVEIDITMNIDMRIDLEIDMGVPASDITRQTYASMLDGDYDVRYIIDIYEADDTKKNSVSNRVKRIVKTESEIPTAGEYHLDETIRLPVKKYRMITWIDFVTKGTTTDKYYNTEDLQKIAIILPNGTYQGYNSTRDAFTATVEMDLTPYRGQRYIQYEAVAEVVRPFAIYRIITTDIDEYKTYHQTLSYASIQPNTTNVAYNLFFPMGYNAYLYAPDNFRAGIAYSYDITETAPEKEALLASDYVFVKDDTFYTIDFEILSSEKQHINTVNGLRINLKRNQVTTIRDEFLTKDLNDGKVGVDDRFTDEIIIRI
ncbi:hypothetical protein EZS27_008496 [termite gut metagenome]|uniref:DUF6562 domain-containing protein n=1 Tax=termite gut metagenome TaxID=433724 RepID=A0A5J4SEY1_9ZZZZ